MAGNVFLEASIEGNGLLIFSNLKKRGMIEYSPIPSNSVGNAVFTVITECSRDDLANSFDAD